MHDRLPFSDFRLFCFRPARLHRTLPLFRLENMYSGKRKIPSAEWYTVHVYLMYIYSTSTITVTFSNHNRIGTMAKEEYATVCAGRGSSRHITFKLGSTGEVVFYHIQ